MNKSAFRSRAPLVALIFSLLTPISVEAATHHVNVTTDDGTGVCTASRCTLRDAILSAASGDEITFSLPANSTIALTNGSLSIDKVLRITGPGPALLTIERSSAANTADFRIVDLPSTSAHADISGVTIANGVDHSVAGGSAIHNVGVLTLTNCTLSGNVGTEFGGGISNSGTLLIDGGTIAGNSSPNGAGIYNFGSGTLELTNSTISGNTNGGSSGGGIFNWQNAAITISNSTISGNTAADGGGIFNNSPRPLTITNSTISGNTAHSTCCTGPRSGGGILNATGATVNLRNSIVAKNTADLGPDIDNAGTTTSQGYNLIGNNQGAGITATTGDQIGTPAVPIDPLLGPLQDNGGPTKTQALLSGSRAIDKGDSGGSVTDQRGFNRPVDTPLITNSGDGSDVGAYEVQADQLAGCSEINLIVNNLSDSDAGSLRSVIISACSGSTITFAPNVRGTIALTNGELVLNKNLVINGPGANLLTVQRSATAATNFRIFHINGNFHDAISGLTIAKGFLPANLGGGISNDNGTLTLGRVTVSGNTADIGAGIYTARAATITSSTISGNTVSGNNPGDGGGAIYNEGGTLNLVNSTLSGNIAQLSGGGGQGGGIRNNLGTVSITNTTIAGNSADQGGGIYHSSGGVTLQNSIIAQNTSANGPDLNGTFASNGFNLIGNSTLAIIFPANQASDQVGTAASPIDPLLGPLRDNGGPTFTQALLSGSVAIDKGNASGSTADQRGFTRPVDQPDIPNVSGGDGSDIGAFEFGGTFYRNNLANISTRLFVDSGDNVLIGGFIITGTQPKKVILRAIGPALNLAGELADPFLELHDSTGALITSNDNWMDAPNRQEIIDSTIPPGNDLESAILMSLSPGAYTAIVRGVNNTTGIALVEAYDLDLTVDSKLANISTRGLVQTGNDVMIGGFIVVGPDSQRVIVRAIGPSLPVPGALADPALELHDGNGALLQSNDNWRSDQEAEIIATTIPPSNDFESAIVRTLVPGNYTAIVRGVNSTTGIALVEAYGLN